jgi:hypothetical protein
MFILLSGHSGTPKTRVSELLKQHWAKLGTAVYVCDAAGPIDVLHEGLLAIGEQFELSTGPAQDSFIREALLDWGRMQDPGYWGTSARKRADEVCARWSELGLHHVAVIEGLCFREDFRAFPRAYRVYLKNEALYTQAEKRGPVHESEKRLFSIAINQENGGASLFDEIFNIDDDTPENIATDIAAAFNRRLESGFTEITT